MKTIINNEQTLNEMVDTLERAGAQEVTRVLPMEDYVVVEWN